MAIVKMNKFTAIGIDAEKEALLTELMDLGVAEINSPDSKLADEEWAKLITKEAREGDIMELEGKINMIDGVLSALETYDSSKKPMFKLRKSITSNAFEKEMQGKAAIESDVNTIRNLSNSIRELISARNKIETTIIGLTPWISYPIPLDALETKFTNTLMGIVPPDVDINNMKSAISEATGLFELSQIGKDQEQQYVSLTYMKEEDDKITDALRQFSFNKLFFKDLHGTVTEIIARLKSELVDIDKKIEETKKGFEEMVASKGGIQMFYDYLAIEQDKAKAFNKMLVTGRSFYIDGWVPADESVNLAAVLKKHGCYYEITEPAKDEDTPVLLRNNNFISPVETITNLYDTPSSKEIDPTPIYAMFYICFYGIMFADVGYGLVLAILCFTLVKKGILEGNVKKFIKQLGYCGVSATFWGFMFGSFFGNLIQVTSGHFFGVEIGIKPIWMDPVNEPMKMLVFACIFGVVHLFVGMGIKAYALIKRGNVLEAVNKVFLWYALITGLGLLLFGDMIMPGAGTIGMVLSIIGAGGVVILPVFTGKGIGKLLGLWNLYGISNYLADILSYARLLALCLASAVIAQVFNILASFFGTGVVGVIMFIIIVCVAHVFNFLLSGLGAFVHSIRLQYVEFFSKFFEGKGTPFQPFMKNTKYVKIVKEEN